jgi:biopolymer transport protein ExbD
MAFSAAADTDARNFADINITPLVDVMLVLLILFMLSAPLVMQRLDLPLAPSDRTEPEIPQTLELRLSAEGALTLDGRAISLQALRGVLAIEASRGDPPILSIEASPEASYQTVAEVLALARNEGLMRLQLQGH